MDNPLPLATQSCQRLLKEPMTTTVSLKVGSRPLVPLIIIHLAKLR